MKFAIRSAIKMRKLVQRRRDDPTLLLRLRGKVHAKEQIEEMQQSSAGWKVLEAELQKQGSDMMIQMANPATSDEAIGENRRLFLATGLLRSIMSRIVAEGNDAQQELKLLTEKEVQHG